MFTIPARAILRLLLTASPMLAACTPSPQKAAMPSPSPASGTPAPAPQSVAAAGGPAADSSQDAEGRRILSTAFVRIGVDGHLTVELRSGRVLVLRDVTMGPDTYCGVQVGADSPSGKYCGRYAEVTAARPGGGPQATGTVEQAPGTPVKQ